MTVTLAPPDPPLAADGICLRPWRVADVPQLVAACQDPAIQRFIPVPVPYDETAATDYVHRTDREWASGLKAAFAVTDAEAADRLLGAINVAISGGVGNSGYWVAPWARRAGVASTALRLLTSWAFEALGLGLVILEIRPENAASRRVAAAAGYHEAGHLEVQHQTGKQGALLFARLVTDPPPR